MDFAKFCSLLEKSELFFAKPETFKDPWEGYLPKKHYEDSGYDPSLPEDVRIALINMAKNHSHQFIRNDLGVNCWHIGECESEAFWRNYSDRGVVIQSTFGKLKESFSGVMDYDVYIGTVEYKDPLTDIVDTGNMFNQILWKRDSFSYEKELRAVIWARANSEGRGIKDFNGLKGQALKVDIDSLIEKVYSTPFEKDLWFNDVVNDVIRKYGFKFTSFKSTLMDNPLS